MTDPIADFLTRIRNAVKANHKVVEAPGSKIKQEITKILFDQGYILAYKFDKDEKEMDDTREHSDYSVIGSNFINYLASIMSSRMLNLFESSGVLEKNTYGDVMRLLQRLKKTRVGEGEWQVRRIAKVDVEEVQKLGLFDLPIVPSEPKKKRGRPKGSKDKVPRKRSKKTDAVGQ
mgnify:CR=1 FL=1